MYLVGSEMDSLTEIFSRNQADLGSLPLCPIIKVSNLPRSTASMMKVSV